MEILTRAQFVTRYCGARSREENVGFEIQDDLGSKPWRVVYLTISGVKVAKTEFHGSTFEWGGFALNNMDIFATEPEPLEDEFSADGEDL